MLNISESSLSSCLIQVALIFDDKFKLVSNFGKQSVSTFLDDWNKGFPSGISFDLNTTPEF